MLDSIAKKRLALAALACDESVAGVYSGRPTRAATYARIMRAAKMLRLPLPPPHKPVERRQPATVVSLVGLAPVPEGA